MLYNKRSSAVRLSLLGRFDIKSILLKYPINKDILIKSKNYNTCFKY